MLQKEFCNGYGMDVNSQAVYANAKAAEIGVDVFVDVKLMDEYLDEPDKSGYRAPNVEYRDVEGTEYLEVIRVDKDGNCVSRLCSNLTESEVWTYIEGFRDAMEAVYNTLKK